MAAVCKENENNTSSIKIITRNKSPNLLINLIIKHLHNGTDDPNYFK